LQLPRQEEVKEYVYPKNYRTEPPRENVE